MMPDGTGKLGDTGNIGICEICVCKICEICDRGTNNAAYRRKQPCWLDQGLRGLEFTNSIYRRQTREQLNSLYRR
jgi:hypothetical protein